MTGPCAVPFTLEKQTALRVSLIKLVGPVLNVFYTSVKQVQMANTKSIEGICTGSGIGWFIVRCYNCTYK